MELVAEKKAQEIKQIDLVFHFERVRGAEGDFSLCLRSVNVPKLQGMYHNV